MQTTTIELDRAIVLRRLEQADAYEFLTVALPYLDANPGDSYLRLMAAREYLRLGLVAPARELMDASDEFGSVDGLRALRDSVSRLPGGVISWDSLRTTFGENLAAMQKRGFDVASVREAWEQESDDFRLFRDGCGQPQIQRRREDDSWEWVPALRHHERAESAEPMPDGVGGMMPGPYLFDGLGLGRFLSRVHAATRNTFHGFSCAVYLVEPDTASFGAFLHLGDWSGLLGDERVLVFVGDEWIEHLARRWQEEPDLPLPRTVLALGRRRREGAPTAAEVVQAAQTEREQEILRSFARIEAQYAGRDGVYWARRFDEALSGRGAPLRVLAGVSTHTTFLQYAMRDAQRALETLGHRCVVLTEQTPYQWISPLSYHRAIRELDPDLFFNIDHLRPEFSHIVPRNLPILTWDQDQLPQVITSENLGRLAPHDFVVGCSKPHALRLGADPRQFRYTQMPTCPEQFGGDELTDEELARFTCDVSYVSHASQTPREFHDQERKLWIDIGLGGLVDALFESYDQKMPDHGTPTGCVVQEMLADAMRRTGVRALPADLEARLTGWYLWRLGDRIFRHQALEWAAGWSRRRRRILRIHGNGWDHHPTLGEFAAGPVRNGRELVCVYRASRINLQLMPAGFLHQRALDGLAAGGFFLARETAGDFAAPALRGVLARCGALAIRETSDLARTTDPELAQHVEFIRAHRLHSLETPIDRLLAEIAVNLEVACPGEVFPSFREIVFQSAETFDAAATRFVEDATARRRIADDMRRTVLERFSYRSTMDGFLREMASYLRSTASS